MIILSTAIYVVMILAMAAAMVSTVHVNRMQTLSKNFEWVIANREFAQRYANPPHLPLYLAAMILIAFTLYGGITESKWVLDWGKSAFIGGAVAVLSVVYYFLEKNIGAQIPLREKRTASFEKRCMDHYISRGRLWFAHGSATLALAAFPVMFMAGSISAPLCVANFLTILFVYGIMYGSMIWAINEKTPHYHDTGIVTRERLSENYRKFSINIIAILIVFMSILFLICAGCLWFGHTLVESPLEATVFRMLGETQPLKPAMSLPQYELIVSLFMIPLFIYVARCKAIRDIVQINVVRDGDCVA